MKTINIIKILGIIGLLFLLPSISNAQIQRVWNIAEYTSTIPAPPATGTKVAYRTLNNSLYYWDGTQWKRIAGPGIVDTTYSLSFSSPNLSLLGSGSSVSLTNLYTAGYGLIKTGETWRADTTSPNGLATRLFAKTLPTSIIADRSIRSNGSNLVVGNFTDNGTKLQALLPFQLHQWTTAGRPSGVTGYKGLNTSTGFEEGYFTSQWENYITSTGASANQVPYYLSAGKIGSNSGFTYNPSTNQLGVTSSGSTNYLLANFQNTSAVLSYIQIANATRNILRFEYPGVTSWDLNVVPSLFSINSGGTTRMSVNSSGAAVVQTSLAVPTITGLQALTITKTDNGAFYLPLTLQLMYRSLIKWVSETKKLPTFLYPILDILLPLLHLEQAKEQL